MIQKLDFRLATKADSALVLQFITELAKYEKMSSDVIATEKDLQTCLFTEKRAEVIFALLDKQEIGFAVFFHNFSTFLGKAGLYLEDIFIKPNFRGQGYGKAMFKELARIATERNCARMEWSCLNWNKPSIDFYVSLGAIPMSNWTVYRKTV